MTLTLVLPPLSQLNTPYPSTAYLAAFLRDHGVACVQRDLGLELALRLFSREGLTRIFEALPEDLPEPAWRALSMREQHLEVVEPLVRFLQGLDRSFGPRILSGALPGGPRLDNNDLSHFGRMSGQDAARHMATLYLEDLADLVTTCVDDGFGLARYQHHLAVGPASFDDLWSRLEMTSVVDELLDELADTIDTEVVGLSVPFPGSLYGALRLGRRLRARGAEVWMGGGYINTELREVDEPRLWHCVDALTYDDGEEPLLALIKHRETGEDDRHRTRTAAGVLRMEQPSSSMTCAGWYGELDDLRYLDLIDRLNPAHRLWADGRWSKITLAHGCYWRRCTFCDVELDYINRYQAASTERLVDAMEERIVQSGRRGFHFVDEAAPPRGMKALALELLGRGVQATWWGNIRFETAFSYDLCRLLAASGLVAVTGGLEAANTRILELMDKGVTVEQVARAARNFRYAGVMVHAYLMYGFPSQSDQETLDSAEIVRQLFNEGALDSAFWHRFVLTRHAPIFQDPARYGVEIQDQPAAFAANDIDHLDPAGGDHDRFDALLPRWLGRWMKGEDLEHPLPGTTEAPDRIHRALHVPRSEGGSQLVWIGGEPLDEDGALALHGRWGRTLISAEADVLDWLTEVLEAARPGTEPLSVNEAVATCPASAEAFWPDLRRIGLLQV
ncbi:MAG TPA: radical SAM protein [Myxococcota bacterium]|nr:radical SAM protein [Myxococcota bacterium]